MRWIGALLVVALLAGCGQSPVNQSGPPPLREVAEGTYPPSPYWLGPPADNSALFFRPSIPGSGELVYATGAQAREIDIDASQAPLASMRLRVVRRSAEQARVDALIHSAPPNQSFVKSAPKLKVRAFLSANRRRAEVPVSGGRYVIIVSAANEYLVNEALRNLQRTVRR